MSVWAMGDDLKTLQRSAEADVNLVVSAVGLRVAKILWEKYKIPYVIGTPNEWLAEDISNALERAATRQAEPAVDSHHCHLYCVCHVGTAGRAAVHLKKHR